MVYEGLKRLDNQKYVHYSFEGNSGIRLLVLPRELNSINCCIRIETPSFSEFHITTSANRIALFYCLNSSMKYLSVFNDNLEVLHEFKFEEDSQFVLEKLTSNQELILCLALAGASREHHLRIFNWSLNELTYSLRNLTEKLVLPKFIFQFEADNFDHLFIRYEDVEENCYLNTISLTSWERVNRFVGYPYKDFVACDEQLIVSYRLQSLFYIDSAELTLKKKRDGIRLSSSKTPDNDKHEIEVTKLFYVNEREALFYGKDRILHFVFL